MENKIISISELKGKEFLIPDYQRGYRWGKEQIEALLNDLKKYDDTVNDKENNPYYLQPIIVRSIDNDQYEVIDGQQRLTTICLLLKYCIGNFPFTIKYGTKGCWQDSFQVSDTFMQQNLDHFHIVEVYRSIQNNVKSRKGKYTLFTKDNCGKILKNIRLIWTDISGEGNDSNKAIDNFTNINSGKIKLTCAELIKGVFLQQNIYRGVGTDSDSSISNEEERLVQAVRSLVKHTKEANALRSRIAREWDEYERMLGDDDFWYFLYDQECGPLYDTRIEYVFNLVCGIKRGDNPLKAFNDIYTRIVDKHNDTERIEEIQKQWDSVGKYLATLHNWWKNKEMYHLIGYLICVTPWITIKKKEDQDLSEKSPKTSVISYFINGLYGENNDLLIDEKNWTKKELLSEIKKYVVDTFESFLNDEDNSINFEELTYSNRDSIRRALLFFNISTILKQKGDDRFPFKAYKTERWDIEHIASQTDFNVNNKDVKEKDNWCLALLQYFTGIEDNLTKDQEITYPNGKKSIERVFDIDKYNDELEQKIKARIESISDDSKKELCRDLCSVLKDKQKDKQNYDKIQESVKKIFNSGDSIQDEDKDRIGNLTLLNMSINRGYGNAIFPIKRMTVIQDAEEGYYVPICTQKVFQKAYSRQFDQLYAWTKNDSEAYEKAIEKEIQDFCNNDL